MIEVKTEIKKYLKYCSLEKKLSKHTLKAYRIDLAQFIAFKPDISISKEDLTKYIQYLHKTYKPYLFRPPQVRMRLSLFLLIS